MYICVYKNIHIIKYAHMHKGPQSLRTNVTGPNPKDMKGDRLTYKK